MTSLADEFLADLFSDEEGEDGVDQSGVVKKEEGVDVKEEPTDHSQIKPEPEDQSSSSQPSAADSATSLIEDPTESLKTTLRDLEILRSRDHETSHLISLALDRVAAGPSAPPPPPSEAYSRVLSLRTALDKTARNALVLLRRLRAAYSPRFPEIEQLVPDARQFAEAVRILGDSDADEAGSAPLASVLPQRAAIGVALSAATSSGQPLGPARAAVVAQGAEMLIKMLDERSALVAFVAAHMESLAPNVCAIVGPDIAAQLVAAAGGLDVLAGLPANAVQLLGQKKLNATSAASGSVDGLSNAAQAPHTGIIYGCAVVQNQAPERRMRASRVVAGKVALAARLDWQRGGGGRRSRAELEREKEGSTGADMKEAIVERFDKETAPPPVAPEKPIPAPDMKPKKRRGGRRLRKQKAKYEMTEMQRQMNRIGFNVPQEEDIFTMEGYGMLGRDGSGRISVAAVDRGVLKRVKSDAAKTAAAEAGLRTAMRTHRVGTVSGLASVAFAPGQAMELEDPSFAAPAQEKSIAAKMARAENDKDGMFSSVNSFSKKRLGSVGNSNSSASTDTGVFLVPQ